MRSNINVKIKKLHPDAVIPQYAKEGDAGMDLVAVSETWNDNNTMVTYDTGLAMEIPNGCVGLLFPRSSVSKTTLSLANCVGVIDSGYRGSVMLKFRYLEEGDVYDISDRVGQLVIVELPFVKVTEVDELSSTERGAGGFGSTGK
jgi:dUTP pyrophosphatase